MLRRGVSRWKQVRELYKDSGISRQFSEAASGGANKPPVSSSRLNSLGEDAVNSKLFEKARAIPEANQASETIGEEATASAATKILKRVWNTIFTGAMLTSAYFGYYTFRYTTDQVEDMIDATEKPENEFFGSSVWVKVMSWYAFQRAKMEKEVTKYAEPPSDKLLPDRHPQIASIQTLVLDLDDLLIHSDWTRGRGWRTFKRPGADDFIKHMAQFFELVLYTHQQQMYAEPILERLDPGRLIQYRLTRDATRYIDGKHMRDLSKLNRDLSKVLILTTDPDTTSLQKENTVVVKKWKLENEDTELLDLIPFLEALASARNNIDVRDVIASYDGQNIPEAFRLRMQQAAESRLQRQKNKMFRGFTGQ